MVFGGKIHSELTLDLNFKDVQIPTKGGSARAFQVESLQAQLGGLRCQARCQRAGGLV